MVLYINFKVERFETQGIVDKNNGNRLIKGLVRPSDWPPDTEAAGGTERLVIAHRMLVRHWGWSSLIETYRQTRRLIIRQGGCYWNCPTCSAVCVCSSYQTLKHKKDKKKTLWSISYICSLWGVLIASFFFSRYITNSRLMTMMNISKFSRVSSMSCRVQRSSTIRHQIFGHPDITLPFSIAIKTKMLTSEVWGLTKKQHTWYQQSSNF